MTPDNIPPLLIGSVAALATFVIAIVTLPKGKTKFLVEFCSFAILCCCLAGLYFAATNETEDATFRTKTLTKLDTIDAKEQATAGFQNETAPLIKETHEVVQQLVSDTEKELQDELSRKYPMGYLVLGSDGKAVCYQMGEFVFFNGIKVQIGANWKMAKINVQTNGFVSVDLRGITFVITYEGGGMTVASNCVLDATMPLEKGRTHSVGFGSQGVVGLVEVLDDNPRVPIFVIGFRPPK